MLGPINGEIARLRVAELEEQACRARRERRAARHQEAREMHPRRAAILGRLRKA
jgi:hypothetical protein